MNPRVIVFAKHPTPGRVKTRLAATIGAEPAATLYRAFVVDLIEMLTGSAKPWLVELHTDIESSWLSELAVPTRLQHGEDLGQKLLHSLSAALQENAPRVLILGSDAPALTLASIEELLRADADIALGPTPDGGYWGIAAARVHPAMFQSVRWSTADTFADTRAACEACGLSVISGEPCGDIDDAGDLARLRDQCARDPDSLGPRTRAALVALPALPNRALESHA